jgi:hypothetical protein
MTKKESAKLIEWAKEKGTPKPIKGYIYVHSSFLRKYDKASEYSKEFAEEYKHFFLSSDENGFRFNNGGVTFKTPNYTTSNSHKVFIPYKYIQAVRPL